MKLLHCSGSLDFGTWPVLMGILNVTPDSFSDGGMYATPDAAVKRADEMICQGAAIIDIGGESTRPGAAPVGAAEECDRVLPAIERIRQVHPNALISIDTSKAAVARAAVTAGAAVINDVSGGQWDPKMFEIVRQTGAGYICMHTFDRPERMQQNPEYRNVTQDVLDFLLQQKRTLLDLGVQEACLAFDAGIGFGKTLEHNLDLIRTGGQGGFASLQRPMLWGLSRKSFIDKKLERAVEDRLSGGLAAYASLLRCPDPQIWRVHDVRATADFLAMYQELLD
ncbi:MAG: dihydropteroate synthase [Verrucomicrobiota bacterium]